MFLPLFIELVLAALLAGCAAVERVRDYLPFTPSVKIAVTPFDPKELIIADQSVIDLFDTIPPSALHAAAEKKVFFEHASTGGYISEVGLNYLQGTRGIPNYPQMAEYQYDRRNWTFQLWGSQAYNFPTKLNEFRVTARTEQAKYDVLGMKFCYLDWKRNNWTRYRDTMLKLEADYPDKKFIWSTQALLSNWSYGESPNQCTLIEGFNKNVREFARTYNKPLFDVAAIESHDAQGNACYTGCETMCSQYLGEENTGHPNAEGSIRLAKGFWWTMARISGWQP